MKIRLAMLASGRGTNVANFIEYFKIHELIEVALVISDQPEAEVLKRAAKTAVPHLLIRREQWKDTELVLGIFRQNAIDYIILAGFLSKIPAYLLAEYPERVFNIHPALLPRFGGKGMYGLNVHKAVLINGENQSGITIHLVNEEYDEGHVVFQAQCTVEPNETPESLAAKVQQLEYQHYPRVVEQLVLHQAL